MGGAELHSKAPVPRPLSMMSNDRPGGMISNSRPGSMSGRPTSITGPSPSWAGNRKNSVGRYSESDSPVQYDPSSTNSALNTTFDDHVYAVPSADASMITNNNDVSFNVDAVGLDVSGHSMGSVGATSTWVPGTCAPGASPRGPFSSTSSHAVLLLMACSRRTAHLSVCPQRVACVTLTSYS